MPNDLRKSRFLKVFNFPKVPKSIIKDILRFSKHFVAVSDAQRSIIIVFRKCSETIIVWHFRKMICFFDFVFANESLYEPSRQWLGWQFTGGPRFVLSCTLLRSPTTPWGILECIDSCHLKIEWNRKDGPFGFPKISSLWFVWFFLRNSKSILSHILRLFM